MGVASSRMTRCLPFAIALVLSLFAGSVLAAPATVTLPLTLHKIHSRKTGELEYKLGIALRLGGGPMKLYEFDTGAPGLFAAKRRNWWPHYTLVDPDRPPITQTYSSGNTYVADITETTVDFGHGIPPIVAHVAQVLSASGGNVQNWDRDVAEDRPPLYGKFHGDFGIDLSRGKGVSGLLPQLPDNLSTGFIVSTGGFANHTPFLTIGLTDDLRTQFTSRMRMRAGKGFFPNRSGRHMRHFQQELVRAQFEFQSESRTMQLTTGAVFDTGAPGTEVHDLGNAFGFPKDWVKAREVPPGVEFSMSHRAGPVSPWELAFRTGTTSGLNEVKISKKAIPPHKVAYVNTGLVPFFRFEVMFDLERGQIGFRPIRNGPPRLHVAGEPGYSVNNQQIVLNGSAAGLKYLVQRVEARVGNGPFQRATGIRKWSVPLTLASGQNVVTVRAVDLSGRATTRRVTITAP